MQGTHTATTTLIFPYAPGLTCVDLFVYRGHVATSSLSLLHTATRFEDSMYNMSLGNGGSGNGQEKEDFFSNYS